MKDKNDKTRDQLLLELAAKNRIAEVFLTIPDDEMYGEILRIFLEATASRFGIFGYIDEEDGSFVVPSMTRDVWDKCNVPDKTIVFPREKWGESIWPRAIRQKKTLFSNEASTRTPKGHITISRNISVPIVLRGEVVGLFQVANKETDYDENDIQMLEGLAGHIAPILKARLQRDRQEKERGQGEEEIKRLTAELERRVELQSRSILELSTPTLQLWDEIVVLPLVGVVDTARAQQIMEGLLQAIVHHEARVAILDVTGVPVIDTRVAQHLIKTVTAAGMMGATVLVTGVSPEAAQTLTRLHVDISALSTRGTLRAGIAEALRLVGQQIVSAEENSQ